MTTVTANDKDLTVAYKVDGKLYNTNTGEAGSPDPFDQVVVKAGTSFEVPGTLVFVKELGGAPAQGGTPEDVKSANVPDNAPTPGGVVGQGGTPD